MPARVPDAEGHQQLRRYPLRRLRVPAGGRTLSLVVPDATEWIRRGSWVAGRSLGKEPPYWVQVWPASVGAARMLARPDSLNGLRVLDLGCGLGLPGVAAAAAGAQVTFVDQESDAVAFAVWNAEQSSSSKPCGIRGDWFETTIPGEFDVVVLADVTYRARHHEPIWRHVCSGLSAHGVVLHCDPFRAESTPFVQSLRDSMSSIVEERNVHHDQRRTLVRVVMASRSSSALAAWAERFGVTSGVRALGQCQDAGP